MVKKSLLFQAGMLAVVIVALTVIVAVAEAVARSFGLGNPIQYYENESYRYALAPNQSVVRLRGAGIRTDAYGFRTDDDWDRAGATRVLFLGDSVTYGGAYIDNQELFSAVTCERLRESGVDAVCANAGINGYGTDNMAYRIRFDRAPAADVYVVTLISNDTLRGMASLMTFPYFSRPPPAPVPALTEGALFLVDRYRARLRYGRIGGPSQKRTGDHFEVARSSLERLFGALVEKTSEGRQVLLVHSPRRRNVASGYDEFDRFVLGELKSSGFQLLEMLPTLQAEWPIEGFFYDGTHLERGGHRVYGRTIAEALLGLGIL